ncbi:hypothetical protein [Nocardioides marmoribigeumensis]|uniref:Phage terminase large subunit-like protein n=1 Tax=Nocardioides marmoribigeumensis TaxID=433649 RepID=A0ABU2BYA8_9ACTN|nr:hypothetical protein [Nocardioides marmoribigeumensis]MDR7363379.1 phage terminase large subunit-like protein [Nocardioides marmoribigeumensis]
MGLVLALAGGLAAVLLSSPGATEAEDVRGKTSASGGPDLVATPSRTPSATPAPPPLRTCWDGSTIRSTARCPVPRGHEGLEVVSPTFAEAHRAGHCRPSPDDHTAGGYLCLVDGAELHFAWFSDIEKLDAHFAGIYPTCRHRGTVAICHGPEREALRYVDQRFLFEVTSLRSQRDVLLGVRLRPADELLEGDEVS